MEIKCPHCNKKQENKPKKEWVYKMGEKLKGRKIELTPLVNCLYYSCICGKGFTCYVTKQGKMWTIPKIKK